MYYSQDETQQGIVSRFMYKVYGWMSVGLAITAALSYYLALTPEFVETLRAHSWLLFAIFIFQFALVMGLSFFINRMDYMTAVICFLVYAASVGFTLAPIFLVYEISSIYLTFLSTASMFGVMCLYGYFTRSDLTTMGNISLMALIGIIIASFINIFLKSPMMDYIISGIGVIVFTVLTAYDSQKIRHMAQGLMADEQTRSKIAVLGALTMYLDFINLFLFLLRFLGNKRDE
jgi:FtsH-binding integral membrane protein